jgi:uncharacterized repeat protein (TIGR01451 family)
MALLRLVMSHIGRGASWIAAPLQANGLLRVTPRGAGRWGAALCLLVAGAVAASAQVMSIPGKFAVNPAGAATYTIPIAVPPGIAGVAPALSLEYGSQSGNGILGIGWSLGGLPLIVRCPQTMVQNNLRGSVNYDGGDRFCLDGQQLVAISGPYGASGTEYRTEVESFNRIISHGAAGTGPAWFEVHTKSGQVMEFGHTADSQILTQGNPTARSWAVNKVSDTVGNSYSITYTNDSVNGQNYPSHIDYAGNSVQFTYATRPDVILAYQAGSQLKTTVLLTDITTSAAGAPVADYRLAYQQPGAVPLSQLTGVTLCSGDGSTCLPATTFGWASGGDGTFSQHTQNIGLAGKLTLNGDFNGDGMSDLVVVSGTTIVTFLSNGNGTFTQHNWSIPDDIGSPPNILALSGDVDGDGKSDVILINLVTHSGGVGGPTTTNIATFISKGDGTYNRVDTPITNLGSPPRALALAGDFDGDGRSDFVLAAGTTVTTFLSIGNGRYNGVNTTIPDIGTPPTALVAGGDFDGDGKSDLAFASGTTLHALLSNGNGTFRIVDNTINNIGTPPSGRVTSGDFNGDSKTDFVLVSNNTLSTFLSQGDGTFKLVSQSVAGLGSPSNFVGGDMNGDGRSDLVAVTGNTIFTLLSKGDGNYVASSQSINVGGDTLGGASAVGGDFNGDGKSDFAVFGSSTLYTLLGNGGPGYLVTGIATGLGATTAITYQPLTNGGVYTKNTTSIYPTLDVVGPLYVVSRVDASNGIGGTFSSAYSYAGAKSDFNGRGFLGFAQMNTLDLQTGIAGATYFNQAFPLIGTVATELKTLNGNTLNRTDSAYQFLNASNHSTISSPSISSTTGDTAPYRVSLSSRAASSNDLDATPLPTITTTYGQNYDAYNNPTSVVVSASDGYSKTANNVYNNDPTKWLLGRLIQAQVTATAPTPPAPPTPPPAPDLTVTSSHSGAFTQGQTGAYTITVSNVGAGPTSGAVTVEDTVPTGLTATTMAGDGWTCEVGVGSPNCTRSDVLAAGASYPAITLTVNVAANAPSSVTNVVTVSGGGEVNTGNDTYNDPTSISAAPDMTVALSDCGCFSLGGRGTYTITATNVGQAASSGTVTVVDTLPSGLSAIAMSGSGWSCTPSTLTCTRSDPLAAGSSYPVITLAVNVATNAPNPATNVATVSGGGEINTNNDTASDPTTMYPAGSGNKIYLTSGSSWTVPSNWNASHNTIEVIGGGGGGAPAVLNGAPGGGGGGGGYSQIANLPLTPGGAVTYHVGTGGGASVAGGDSWFNGATLAAASVGAKGGGGASGASPGVGGVAGNGVGSTTYSGGRGGIGGGMGGGGGGSAAGPNGAGPSGGDNPSGSLGGSGGGGSGNGPGSGMVSNAGAPASGGYGGKGGSGGGVSGPGGDPTNFDNLDGSAGISGGGGGGGAGVNNFDDGWGGTGSTGSEWSASYGSGSGAGGGGGGNGSLYAGGGGNGGTYGGGGGGGGTTNGSGNTVGRGASGAQGLIVITYWP